MSEKTWRTFMGWRGLAAEAERAKKKQPETPPPADDDSIDAEDYVLDLDADIENADWIRSLAWDLPKDPAIAFAFLCGSGTYAEQKANWDHFLTLPAAKPMPPEVREGIEALLSASQAAEVTDAADAAAASGMTPA